MKLSTRIEREIAPHLVWGDDAPGEYTKALIVLMVDCGRNSKYETLRTRSITLADEYHRYLTQDEHCKLLHKESPVVNGKGEIIYHYTSTTYKDWCNN